MNVFVAFRSALRSLAGNPMRSLLTMLGIIIGVAAVITMIAIGTGAQQRIEEQLRNLGSNILRVSPGAVTQSGVRLGGGSGNTLTEDDARAINLELPDVLAAAPSLRTGVQVVAGNVNWSTPLEGTTPEFHVVREWPLSSGRGFDAAEMTGAGKVALIGQTAAWELFGDIDPIDQVVRVRNVPLRIVGVLALKGQDASGNDQDDTLLVPISTYRNRIEGGWLARSKRISSIRIKVQDGQSLQMAEQNVRDLLRQRHRLAPDAPDDFTIQNLAETLQAQEESSRVMTLLLAAVAGVSLLVGGIGIMNIMLVSVTERTREIGLRMAVGARGRDILSQFLIEAVTLSLLGGAIGVLLGAAATAAIATLAGWQAVMSIQSVLLAVGFAASVGVFFGYYPARRASALLPIQALRHE
jgi:ABC-type antimicrobial peptide transport system permease subunit